MRKKPPVSVKLPPLDCVIKVGEGRGFVVEQGFRRIVVTAAHCLSRRRPPTHAMSYTKERTYSKLLGPLHGGFRKVWAECLFVDPVADIAVLGQPDNQLLVNQAEDYDRLIESAPALPISGNITKSGWVMSLEGRWVPMPLERVIGPYGWSLFIGHTEAGQSGSPILNEAGRDRRRWQ